MRIKRSILAPAIIALVALATGGWLLQKGASQERNVYFQARLFEEVLHHVSDKFVDVKNPAALYRMAIDGLLEELGDPHSTFMAPEDYGRLRVQTEGEYGGLGIQIDRRDGWITVIAPLPGTPAERAGLMAGDRIIEVDGVSTKDWSADDAVAKLRGPKGAPVNIRVARVGVDQPIPFRIVRDEIHIRSVPSAYMIDDRVGYVELNVFNATSTDELRAAIERLRPQGLRSLVLDMRLNPGGLLDQGVSVSDLFLDRGDAVLETRSRLPNQNQKFGAIQGDQFPGLPVVVLTSTFTASAAEIVAGALQDHDRALVLGQTTYGKGSVQTLFPLAEGNYLKLTTARWYTPSGRSIQRPYGIDRARANGDAEADSAEAEAKGPAYRTDSGRTVYGGGGIRPDLVSRPDTLSSEERAFAAAIEKFGSKYRDAVYRFAIGYARQHPELQPGFTVTPEMLDSFYRALQESGVEVERTVFNGAGRAISHNLGFETSYAKWGQQEARKFQNTRDPQVQLAVKLLREARDPQSLFAVADRYAAGEGSVQTAKGAAKKPAGSQR